MEILTELRHVSMLLAEASSETGNLYDRVSGSRNFGNTKSMRVIFFLKYLKFKLDFKNASKMHILFQKI